MKYTIAVIPGDGVGPEVTNQAKKALDAIAEVYDHVFIYKEAQMGACAIDKTGNPLPDETIEICKNADIVIAKKVDDASSANADEEATEEVFTGYANVIPVRGKESSQDYYLMILSEEVFA